MGIVILLLWRGGRRSPDGVVAEVSAQGAVSVHSPPVEGWQAKLDGVVAAYLHKVQCRYIPLLWRGGLCILQCMRLAFMLRF